MYPRWRVAGFFSLGDYNLFLDVYEYQKALWFNSRLSTEYTNPLFKKTVFQNENDRIGLIIFIPVITFETQTKTFKVTRSKIGQKLQFLGIFNLFLIFLKAGL